MLDIALLWAVFGLVILGRSLSADLPLSYFILYVGALLLAVVRSIAQPSWFVLGQWLLVTLASRAGYWFSAPSLGHDSRMHLAAVTYIVNTGDVIPSSVFHYHYWPISHILGAGVSIITDLGPKHGFFFGIITMVVVSLIVVFLIGERLLSRRETHLVGLLAVAVVVTSSWHLKFTGYSLFAQALATAFVPSILYFGVRAGTPKLRILPMIFFMIVVFTQHFVPAIIGLALTLLIVFMFVLTQTESPASSISGSGHKFAIITLVIFAAVLTVQQWRLAEQSVYTNFLGLQISRVIRIFSGAHDLASYVSVSGNTQGVPSGDADESSPTLFGINRLILYSTTLLVQGCLATIAGHLFVADRLDKNKSDWNAEWILMGISMFGIVAMAFFTGAAANVSRSFDSITIIAAPACAYALYSLRYRAGQVGSICVVVLLLTAPVIGVVGVAAGIPAPFTPPTEKSNGFQDALDSSELAGITFVNEQGIYVRTDAYTAATGKAHNWRVGRFDSYFRKHSKEFQGDLRPAAVWASSQQHPDTLVLYRTHFGHQMWVRSDDCLSVVYDSGGMQLLQPCRRANP